MDLITQTSLEALLLKATTSQNQNIDAAAVEAFCTLINKEKDGCHTGVKIIANRLHAGVEKEVLQALCVLDTCMSRCGTQFQSEVGKFRFLNEMIKLVSPKYLGSHTPLSVRQKVLQLMYLWTLDYPRETKIKEAYDMLRKQGVVREIPNPNISIETAISKRRQTNSIFQDEEKSKVLQKLLQSKDPEDIQAANWLIKSMVKEDDKRAEMKSKRTLELESAQNNIKLLNEMLDNYKPGVSTEDELDLINELYHSCQRLRPSVTKLLQESPQSDEKLDEMLKINDNFTEVFGKYNSAILEGKTLQLSRNIQRPSQSLLDFDGSVSLPVNKEAASGSRGSNHEAAGEKSNMDVLCDIFTASIPISTEILQPVSVLNSEKQENDINKESKVKTTLEDLDVLSEHLMKESLQANKLSFDRKNAEKVPMNLLSTSKNPPPPSNDHRQSVPVDLNYLIDAETVRQKSESMNANDEKPQTGQESNGDDNLVDITTDEKLLESESPATPERGREPANITPADTNRKECVKLSDITIELENVKASSLPPLQLLEERNGVSISLHCARNRPREGVHVYVLTTTSRSEIALSNYLFQAVVPKGCKLKLQPASGTELPACSPFLPPPVITQVMLIASPPDLQIYLKFIVSYCMDDETVTEMGEVENLPIV